MRWVLRIGLGLLILASLYSAPLMWLYWGWRQEKPAREMIDRLERLDKRTGAALLQSPWSMRGPAFLDKLIPGRLGWIRQRLTRVNMPVIATDEDLGVLRSLTQLEVLVLGETRVTDAGLVHLREFPHLQFVWLDGFTDAGMVHLEGLKELEEIDLLGSQISDAGIAHLKNLAGLKALRIMGPPITDAGLAHIKGLTGLICLDLTRTRVTDAGLAELGGLTNLRELYLGGTLVTDEGLVHLQSLSQLRTLYVTETRVTPAGVAQLQAALPNCRVTR